MAKLYLGHWRSDRRVKHASPTLDRMRRKADHALTRATARNRRQEHASAERS
jgi:hypothetical protein